MANSTRRIYVKPNVKLYGAVEQVTQATLREGPGDLLSTILELISGHEQEGCPIFTTCTSYS